MIKLSFILPCYNVELYIGRCLDSILHQDLPLDEYEIICINDCSPDNLRKVVIDYQQKYSNIRLIEHPINKTSGGARNTGIDAARGEYLWFVDPDDTIAENCLGIFYRLAKKKNSDILFFNFKSIELNGDNISHDIVDECTDNCDGISYIFRMFPQNRLLGVSAVWHSLFRREFCVTNHIRFPEIKSSQDVVFLWKSILLAGKVVSSRDYGYIVYHRHNSMTGKVGRYKPEAIFSATILYTNELLNMLENYNEKIPNVFNIDILREIKSSLDDDSRKVMQSPMCHKRTFYRLLKQNKVKIDRMVPYMNDNTKRIFNYNRKFCFWLLFIEWFRIKRIINHLWKA